MMQQLKLAVMPVVAAVITLGQSSVASAAPAQISEGPRTVFVAPSNAHALTSGFRSTAIQCPSCTSPSITAVWGSATQFSPSTIIVSDELAHGLQCGDPLDVAATDLTPLERGDAAMAINISTIACGLG